MKLSPRDAEGYFARPDPDKTGILIYGGDAMRVALKRQQVLAALLGPAAEEEMRLTRMSAGGLRKDPAQLLDAVKAVGFFPGIRAVFVEDANDQAAPAILAALDEWQPGDAQIVVTGGQLKATSKLRKGFEGHRNAYAVGIYDDPPSRAEIERILGQASIRDVPADSMSALTDVANDIGPGDFSRMIEKLALYKHGDSSPRRSQRRNRPADPSVAITRHQCGYTLHRCHPALSHALCLRLAPRRCLTRNRAITSTAIRQTPGPSVAAGTGLGR